jgi:hypothetical protein
VFSRRYVQYRCVFFCWSGLRALLLLQHQMDRCSLRHHDAELNHSDLCLAACGRGGHERAQSSRPHRLPSQPQRTTAFLRSRHFFVTVPARPCSASLVLPAPVRVFTSPRFFFTGPRVSSYGLGVLACRPPAEHALLPVSIRGRFRRARRRGPRSMRRTLS